MTRTEVFEQKVAVMTNELIIELADRHISKMCETYGKAFTMSIPPMIDDTDIVLTELVKRFSILNHIEKERVSIGFVVKYWNKYSGKFDYLNENSIRLKRLMNKKVYKTREDAADAIKQSPYTTGGDIERICEIIEVFG